MEAKSRAASVVRKSGWMGKCCLNRHAFALYIDSGMILNGGTGQSEMVEGDEREGVSRCGAAQSSG